MDIYFKQAEHEELDRIAEIFQAATEYMNQNGILQWDEIYPDKEILSQDIIKNQLFVGMADEEIVTAYVLNQDEHMQYENGNWEYPEDSYYILHRLCVNPQCQNMGIGTLTVEYIENKLQSEGIQSLRLDAFTQNPYALRMYEKLGYKTVGYAYYRKGKFCLMEKHL